MELKTLASLAIFMSFAALSLFFLLKDGPAIRNWTERHMGLPSGLARAVTQRTVGSLRGYFTGVTAVAAFNGIVIGLGALVLDVPQAGSIAVVNFVCAYIPPGGVDRGCVHHPARARFRGFEHRPGHGLIVLLANGLLQQMVQPIAFGAALGIHPLAVLIVTIAGGALFGTVGLILAGPLTSAVVKISGGGSPSPRDARRGSAERRRRPALAILRYLDQWQRRHRAVAFVVAVVRKYLDDRGTSLAALIAYYAFFSVFPLLLVFVSVLGFVLDDDPELRDKVVDSALAQLPVVGAQLGDELQPLTGNGVALAIGLGAALWAGLGVTLALGRAFETVSDIPAWTSATVCARGLRGLLILVRPRGRPDRRERARGLRRPRPGRAGRPGSSGRCCSRSRSTGSSCSPPSRC